MLVRESHGGGMTWHFGVKKTLETLHENFYLPSIKHDVQSVCAYHVNKQNLKSCPMVSIHHCQCLITLGLMFQ